jgi:hypothetical protein
MANSAAAWQAYLDAKPLEGLPLPVTKMPAGGGLDLYDVSIQGPEGLLPPRAEGWKPPRKGRTGRSGGRGGISDAEREAKQIADAYERLKRSLDPLADANAEYADNLKILNDALKAGKITATDYATGLVMVDEAHRKAMDDLDGSTDRLQTMQDGIAGFTDALFDNSTSISDWAQNAVIEFAKVQAQLAILNALGLSTEGVDDSFIGSVIGGLSGKRAMGGPVNANSAYLVGEKGPEIMVPTSSGVVVPNHQIGGGGGPDIQVNIKTPPGTTATTRRRSGGIDIEVMMERKFEEFIESGGADGAMGRSFGLKGRPRG